MPTLGSQEAVVGHMLVERAAQKGCMLGTWSVWARSARGLPEVCACSSRSAFGQERSQSLSPGTTMAQEMSSLGRATDKAMEYILQPPTNAIAASASFRQWETRSSLLGQYLRAKESILFFR